MLPDIDGEKRHEMSTLIAESVLISSGSVLKLTRLLVVSEPAPSGSLKSSSVGTEMSDEIVNGAKRMRNCLLKLRALGWQLTTTLSNRG